MDGTRIYWTAVQYFFCKDMLFKEGCGNIFTRKILGIIVILYNYLLRINPMFVVFRH